MLRVPLLVEHAEVVHDIGFPFIQMIRRFRRKVSNKSGNHEISEKRIIQPKITKIRRGKSNGMAISG